MLENLKRRYFKMEEKWKLKNLKERRRKRIRKVGEKIEIRK